MEREKPLIQNAGKMNKQEKKSIKNKESIKLKYGYMERDA
jgi:hypothetical protein